RLGDAQLLFLGHGRAGALLAVAQRGVEYDDAVVAHVDLLVIPAQVQACRGTPIYLPIVARIPLPGKRRRLPATSSGGPCSTIGAFSPIRSADDRSPPRAARARRTLEPA